MIGLLQGILFFKNDSNIIVMVNGVGYKVEAVAKLLTFNEGDEILVYVYTHVREDAIKLFGFSSEEELKAFEMLLTVSGIGPKGAMSIISVLGVSSLYAAIVNEDPKVFKAVSGIGTKNAEKIIIELKNKIKKDERIQITQETSIPALQHREELEEALITLGYSIAEIKNVMLQVEYSEKLPEMVRHALQLLNRV